MLSFYLIWSSSYFTALWWMSRFWLQKPNSSLNQAFFPKVTLIIPFRNEVLNIPTLSESLSRLRYPNLQVLLIDDHSEDLSFQYLEKWFEGNDTVEVLSSSLPGKKAAVEFGVKRASGEIILCSDADCIFPELWVQGMVLPFQNPEIQLVAGPVMVEERRGFLPAFQSLDWASILLMSAYSFAGKKPLMCSAANLAYRKTAFQK
ncbi:MAG: glycosyltransferase, partial [Algoriphagus sp.]